MSGGHFDYKQHHINEIADGIERIIENNGRKKTQEELKEESWRGDDWYEKYPELFLIISRLPEQDAII